MNKKRTPYLPKIRTNYHPTDKEVESGSGVDFPIDISNPTVDPIAVNNIACQEFDYTEDIESDEESDLNIDK